MISETNSNKTPDNLSVTVDPFYVEDLRQMERAVNYRRWQFEMVQPFLGKNVLEVGAGIGNFTTQLAEGGRRVVSVEPNRFCFEQLKDKTHGLENVLAVQATIETLDDILGKQEKFESVVMMNVLEHIEDDGMVLMALKKRLTAGGRLVILVPAGSWAFGGIDERLGHYRRYSKRYSRRLFASSGLGIEFMRYYNFVGIWGWWWNARMGKLKGQSDRQIQLFDRWLVPIISAVERWIRPPVGQSILVVGSDVGSATRD
jgi:SAM-dependent methyltransferase